MFVKQYLTMILMATQSKSYLMDKDHIQGHKVIDRCVFRNGIIRRACMPNHKFQSLSLSVQKLGQRHTDCTKLNIVTKYKLKSKHSFMKITIITKWHKI